MYNKKAEFLFFAPVLFLTAMTAFGQPSFAAAPAVTPAANAAQDNSAQNNTGLPLKRLALFSSGVGFFQHSGNITGTADSPFEITLPFSYNTVNDVLKSLTVNDPASALPSVNYAASDTLDQTLKSLAIDLSGNPGMAEILNSLKGAEVTISGAPGTRSVEGRIVGVEYRSAPIGPYGYPASGSEPYLTLFTAAGLQSVKLEDYSGFLFADEKINSDLRRALDLLLQSGNSDTRNLTITLPGEGSRDVSISYVIPAPVWKISYRLDLSSSSPLLQGWAIVDNDSDSDWNNIELSLVTGRPVSFIQNLYDPYHTVRPTIPLAIAGVAESRSYDSGYGMAADEKMSAPVPAASPSYGMSSDSMSLQNRSSAYQDRSVITLAGGTVQTAAGNAAGDQFEFTFKQPVNVPRRQSAMLPLMESGIKAEKTLVLSGSQLFPGTTINPAISAQLTNTTGMKLPAGPITVYDGGTYAGDALIEFFPENENRLISFGDDLSVTASLTSSSARNVTSVTVTGGVMTINRRQDYEKVYLIKNASGTDKKIIIEHPITQGAALAVPQTYSERTANLYRFNQQLPAGGETKFTVREEMPVSDRITLSALRPESFLSYSTNQEIPANVRSALAGAIELRRKIDAASAQAQYQQNNLAALTAEQDRIRRNIEAAGNQSPQGLDYLKRLAGLDTDIDNTNTAISAALKDVQTAQQEYDAYIANLDLR